ncbi:MAG: nucleotidyltransferase family protein [Sandarakinorhabdus sp.]|nr:nucleotidyltransferase family protein [Sandarakinorhabdus sp.]
MKSWENALVTPEMSLREALACIDRAGSQMVLVVDDRRRLLGTLSDGDARRGLLNGLSLADQVTAAMHKTPTVARSSESRHSMLSLMRQRGLRQMPVLDAEGIVVGMEVVEDFLNTLERENWVVIMAGGLGKRLEQLTRDTPKPMLRVGSRPLLETIVLGYAAQGFKRFYLAVNYKAEQIEHYFGDGSGFGVEIRYVREQQRLGTAGPLSLLPEVPAEPIVVTNADLLTKENFGDMVDRHAASGADATMAVRDYEMQVPFGVVRERNGYIEAIHEKPIQSFTVSAGIYVLSPPVLALVPKATQFDMPELFDIIVQKGLSARCHRIDGYWLDIGRLPDYERANIEFDEVFR